MAKRKQLKTKVRISRRSNTAIDPVHVISIRISVTCKPIWNNCPLTQCLNKPVDQLAHALQSFKGPTSFHRTATVPIIRNFHSWTRVAPDASSPEF